LQLTGSELDAGFDLFAAVPPIRIAVIEYVLRRGIGLTEIRRLFAGFTG